MYCPNCNTPNPAFNKTCNQCGDKLPVVEPIRDIDQVNAYLSRVGEGELKYTPKNRFEKILSNFLYSNYALNRKLGSPIMLALTQSKAGFLFSAGIVFSLLAFVIMHIFNLSPSKTAFIMPLLLPPGIIGIYLFAFTSMDTYCVKLEKSGQKPSWVRISFELGIIVLYTWFIIFFRAGHSA